MAQFMLASKSDNTSKSYFNGFRRWENFIHAQVHESIPAHPVLVALYITHLLDSGATFSSVNLAVYSIKWAHNLRGATDPTENAFVKNLQESAKREARPQKRRKDPVSSEMLIKLCEIFEDSNDLLVIRDLCMILICFSGFLRFDELSSLICNDIKMFDNYVSLHIRKSKTDQYRSGDEIFISKGSTVACPVLMLQKYIKLADICLDSDHFLFKPVFRSKGICKLIKKNKKLSYTGARESIISKLRLVGGDKNLGLHSMRAGGATAVANAPDHVSDRCWKRHGRWKSENSKDGYVVDSFENRLEVTKHLGI
ncbi:hypothetical protein FSP39_010888 [Pinctada imbricata]|uniref:Tyr recombinase domain-containing protein n=1 Tax=Pinctada imbricata TaxID=66713 RepID=A0AA89BSX3_PINIB|nr:hypothetical protein FSP39_010888 [Pinctada imbricata]